MAKNVIRFGSPTLQEGDYGLHHVTCWNRKKHLPSKTGIAAKYLRRCVACGQDIKPGERMCWHGRNRAIV